MSANDFPPAVLRALKRRSGGVCEHCGVSEAREAHHRQFKSRGGAGVLSNALHLCGWGNHTGCHGTAHNGLTGERYGLAIRSGHNPQEVPFFRLFDGTWWRLDDDGNREAVHPADAVEYMTLIGSIKVKELT